jgi:hypothetical protein
VKKLFGVLTSVLIGFSTLGHLPAQASEVTPATSSDTLIATMYEWEKSFNLKDSSDNDIGTFAGDEYFYRISKNNENDVVDLQWTSGLTQLTEVEQNSYYENFWKFDQDDDDPDVDAYEFTWLVAACFDNSTQEISYSPDAVRTSYQEVETLNTSITTTELEAFWDLSPSTYYSLDNPRLSTEQYLKESTSPVDYIGADPGSFPQVYLADGSNENMIKSSGAYATVDCGPGLVGFWAGLVDQSGTEIVSRSLDLSQGVYRVADAFPLVLDQVDLDGAYVAVYGRTSVGFFTVSHLGVTKIEDPNYTVSYHPNGASEGTLPADASAPAGSFSPTTNTGDLKRPGFTFKGWSTDFKASSPMNTLSLSSDTRLYAVWEEQSSGTVSNPTPYSGPIITTVGFGPDATYSSTSSSPIVISGERLSGVTSARVAGKQAEILSVNSDNFTILLPEGLPVGTHDLSIETNLGNLTYLDAITISAVEGYGDIKAWTKRISDSQVKVYVKYPTVGEKVRISHQTGGSGSYESVYVKTTSSETMEGLRIVEGVGTYIVRTIDLSEINRIRVTVGDSVEVQVRYNN